MTLDRDLSSLVAWGLCILVLAVEPHGVYCSSRGWFGPGKDIVVPPEVGICESSVVPYGYKCQEIDVTTQDGYVLNVQRISEGRTGNGGQKKQPVLIQHGVLVVMAKFLGLGTLGNGKTEDQTLLSLELNTEQSAKLCTVSSIIPWDGLTWLLNAPEENLPMILADNGFDVWIANTRGTRFSRRHKSMDPSKPWFWNWSWDELVTFDLPAVFDHVYKETGQKIDYVGHSLGTLIALASFSEGRLVNQLKSAALLSPIAYLSHMKTALGVVAAKSFVGEITTLFGLAEFNPKGEPVAHFLKGLCAYPGVDCYDLMSALTGRNCCLNSSTVDLFLKNEPQSTSTKNMVHLAQTVRDGVLAKYNYGRPDYNLMHYGEATPPVYNLSNIPHNLPLFISYGGRDALSDVRDVGILLDSLKLHDVDKLTVQFIKDYAHADFIMGVDAKDIVYNSVVSFFKHQH
ncbi:Alpha/beta hydrolase, predicted [Trema orientale]|uniref:Alpha/beta hydrolase, predicted n=1 Tax=Trema orientale TaxID=63057 RepID=A0A2P5FC41_TREOI|nr:Alpha/beta hydrolase, predicted [Trema orientale]